MGCGFGPEFWYSLVASCGVAGLFSTRLRVCVEWVGDSLVPRRPQGQAGILPVWWNRVDTPHSKCGAHWGVRVRVPPRVLVC